MIKPCPYCGHLAENVSAEMKHMVDTHPEIVAERLWKAGINPREVDVQTAQIMEDHPFR